MYTEGLKYNKFEWSLYNKCLKLNELQRWCEHVR